MRSTIEAAAAALLGAALLAGCAQAPVRLAGEEAVSGRFAARYGDPRQGKLDQGVQGRFLWRKGAQEESLELFPPFGQSQARLSASASGARLEMSGGETRLGADADALLADLLGFPLPFARLGSWLRCRPPAASAAARWSESGWTIDCSAYAQDRRIAASGAAAGQAVELKLAIDAEPSQD